MALYGYDFEDQNLSSQLTRFQKGSFYSNQLLIMDPIHRYKVKYSKTSKKGYSECPLIIDNTLLGIHIGSNQE